MIKNGASNLEYQYSIADHQGNTRVVFTSAAATPSSIIATFEGDSGDQSGQFNAGGQITALGLANHTPPTTTYNKAVRLSQNHRVGPSKSMNVYPGDKVDIEVWSYYDNTSGFGLDTTAAAMTSLIASAFGGVSGAGGESGKRL